MPSTDNRYSHEATFQPRPSENDASDGGHTLDIYQTGLREPHVYEMTTTKAAAGMPPSKPKVLFV